MLRKRVADEPKRSALRSLASPPRSGFDRRTFLRRSGVAAGLGVLGALPLDSMRKADALPGPRPGAPTVVRKNVCTHCSVGCTVTAEV